MNQGSMTKTVWRTNFSTETKQGHFRLWYVILLSGREQATLCDQGRQDHSLQPPLRSFELDTTNICIMSEHSAGELLACVVYW